MKNFNSKFFRYINHGEYKNNRVYFTDGCDINDIFYNEIYYAFKDSLENGYKLFYFDCSSTNNIIIPKNDLFFLKNYEDKFLEKEYSFSNETKEIKNLQYSTLNDLNEIFKKNDVSFFCLIPLLNSSGNYYFNFFLITKNNFKISNILNLDSKLLKINFYNQINLNDLSFENIKNMFDIEKIEFKEKSLTFLKHDQLWPFDEKKLKEYIDYMDFLEEKNKLDEKNFKKNFKEIMDKEDFLKTKLFKKERELFNNELFNKLNFEQICPKIFVYEPDIEKTWFFYTGIWNFDDENSSDSNEFLNSLRVDMLPYNLSDLVNYNDDYLFYEYIHFYDDLK